MLAAPALESTRSPDHPQVPRIALFLSLLLHLLLALAWLGFPLPEPSADREQTMTVELAPEPSPSKPDPPKTAPSPQSPPPQPAAAPLPVPQLQPGQLAERSNAPPQPQPKVAEAAPLAQPTAKPRKPAPVTQSERDFVLSQVLRHWRPPADLAAYTNADIRVAVKVGADGYFTDLYDARRPWNPAEVFDGYAALPPGNIQRRTVDAFYQAIRKAQPLRLPQTLKDKAPFPVRLDFRFRDVR